MMLTLLVTSKGVAGVPRASLVVLAGTLSSFGLPLEGVAVILGVDELMDMARTTVNVVGNCLAAAVIARWEGELGPVTATSPALARAAFRGGTLPAHRHLTMIAIASLPAAAALLAVSMLPAVGHAQRQAAPAPVRSAPVANLRYEVTFDSASASQRTLKVSVTLDVGGPGPVLLSLPAGRPARTRSPTSRASSPGSPPPPARSARLGQARLRHLAHRARPAPAPSPCASTTTPRPLDNAMAWSRPDFAFFNGTNLFLYPEGRGFDFPATVT